MCTPPPPLPLVPLQEVGEDSLVAEAVGLINQGSKKEAQHPRKVSFLVQEKQSWQVVAGGTRLGVPVGVSMVSAEGQRKTDRIYLLTSQVQHYVDKVILNFQYSYLLCAHVFVVGTLSAPCLFFHARGFSLLRYFYHHPSSLSYVIYKNIQ